MIESFWDPRWEADPSGVPQTVTHHMFSIPWGFKCYSRSCLWRAQYLGSHLRKRVLKPDHRFWAWEPWIRARHQSCMSLVQQPEGSTAGTQPVAQKPWSISHAPPLCKIEALTLWRTAHRLSSLKQIIKTPMEQVAAVKETIRSPTRSPLIVRSPLEKRRTRAQSTPRRIYSIELAEEKAPEASRTADIRKSYWEDCYLQA